MELKELIAIPTDHVEEKCPFCPLEELKEYKTYSGDDNDSTALSAIMVDPTQLESKQSKARPKDGEDGNQSKSDAQPLPPQSKEARLWIDKGFGPFSSEAHHLISGKQALMGHPFECWIVKGRRIRGDTGYSINNADNGIHAPSIPDESKGSWGGLDPAKKQAAAFWIMEQIGIQFHKGPHNISDKENDPDGQFHIRYDIYIKELLSKMDLVMIQWKKICPKCKPSSDGKKQKPQPNARVNQYLDNLSRHLRKKISRPSSDWDIFLSAFALRYHIHKGCQHKCCCEIRDQQHVQIPKPT
jgi:hypothetical protein